MFSRTNWSTSKNWKNYDLQKSPPECFMYCATSFYFSSNLSVLNKDKTVFISLNYHFYDICPKIMILFSNFNVVYFALHRALFQENLILRACFQRKFLTILQKICTLLLSRKICSNIFTTNRSKIQIFRVFFNIKTHHTIKFSKKNEYFSNSCGAIHEARLVKNGTDGSFCCISYFFFSIVWFNIFWKQNNTIRDRKYCCRTLFHNSDRIFLTAS